MKNESWPTFSFTDLLRPPDGWRIDHAILTTYSADLVVVVTALLALSGCDLDHRRTGSRVELVKAIEALRGRVCVLAQNGRVVIPNTPRPILKLLDKFLRTIQTDEHECSWHPKVAMLRFRRIEDLADSQWRIWLGSRNLTRSMNWEAGMVITSRADGNGRQITGLADLGAALATHANLTSLSAANVADELAALTWECPPGTEVQSVSFLGPNLAGGLPNPPSNIDRVFVVSPFLDMTTVQAMGRWGGAKTRRTLVSTAMELQRLLSENDKVFMNFEHVLIQPLPDLPVEGADFIDEETPIVPETAESESLPPAGLHAKLLFASKGAQRRLWLGSANATERGWEGRNYEAVGEVSISRDVANAIEEFVANCERFVPGAKPPEADVDEKAVEQAHKVLCGRWMLRQKVGESELEIIAATSPPLADTLIQLEVAVLGGAWNPWPANDTSIFISGIRQCQRSDFLQIRLSRGNRMCIWLQVAPCDLRPDEERDRALIAQYLDPRSFLLWLRSVLADEPARASGGDWDADAHVPAGEGGNNQNATESGLMPTVEEILRAWARDSSTFISANQKVASYLHELERCAQEKGAAGDVALLQTFRHNWNTLSAELL